MHYTPHQGSYFAHPKAREFASPSHVYVFVNAPPNGAPSFWVVPSEFVSANIRTSPARSTGSIWHEFRRDDAYRDRWEVFGNPLGAVPEQAAEP